MSEKNQETVADIVAEMRNGPCNWLTPEGIPQQFHDNELFSGFADRIEAAAEREDALWRAAFAKIYAVTVRNHAKASLGENGRRAVAEIMGACNFPDGALDEYVRSFAERDRLRAALKPVLECDALSTLRCHEAVTEARRIYGEGAAAVKECYDVIAVIEGRQALGRPKRKEAK